MAVPWQPKVPETRTFDEGRVESVQISYAQAAALPSDKQTSRGSPSAVPSRYIRVTAVSTKQRASSTEFRKQPHGSQASRFSRENRPRTVPTTPKRSPLYRDTPTSSTTATSGRADRRLKRQVVEPTGHPEQPLQKVPVINVADDNSSTLVHTTPRSQQQETLQSVYVQPVQLQRESTSGDKAPLSEHSPEEPKNKASSNSLSVKQVQDISSHYKTRFKRLLELERQEHARILSERYTNHCLVPRLSLSSFSPFYTCHCVNNYKWKMKGLGEPGIVAGT